MKKVKKDHKKVIKIAEKPPYKIFIDDIRNPSIVFDGEEADGWIVCRSSAEAIEYVKNKGYFPIYIAFDHDLGTDKDNKVDTTIKFIHWMVESSLDERIKGDVPEYSIHSANPVGVQNIKSKMDTWKKIKESC